MSISENKLDFWIANNLNVLFIGKHGVGKTAQVTDAFNRAGLRWKYFSASTLDPYVDFCGVPRAVKDANGNEVLDLLRPREFQNDEVEAIFMDEFNRSHKKVRNAVMELIQFKSINGKKFNNLKIVWAAINPDDGEESYDVETLDQAQTDRFHIKVNVPYTPSSKYFTEKYGKEVSEAAIAWWKELPEDMKNEVSPRRLDYAVDIYLKNGDLKDVLPHKSNTSKLSMTLRCGPIKKQLQAKMGKAEEAKKFIAVENNYAAAITYIVKDPELLNFYIPLMPEEKIATLIASNKNILEYVAANTAKVPVFNTVITEILTANQSKKLVKAIKQFMPSEVKKQLTGSLSYDATLKVLTTWPDATTQQRIKIWAKIDGEFPGIPTYQEAVDTLNVLATKIVMRSNTHTLEYQFQGMERTIGTCLSVVATKHIASLSGFPTPEDVIKLVNPHWNVFITKLSKAIKIQQLNLVQA